MGLIRRRLPGISTLLACQNEEALVGLSIVSFLRFSDEIIVVDNGSTDRSKEICSQLAAQFPDKVRFYDAPHLKDLPENRQWAFERSRYQWVVRGDADYICYTDGVYDCRRLREMLLATPAISRPLEVWLPQPDVHGDFWHTGKSDRRFPESVERTVNGPRLNCVTQPMARIYRTMPGMRFDRLGRWEGVRRPLALNRMVRRKHWPAPIWMHCNLKSDENFFLRRERTNWRELGDFETYPTLWSYVHKHTKQRYGTDDVKMAMQILLNEQFFPRLVPYDPEKAFPYPRLVQEMMQRHPIYQIEKNSGGFVRQYGGPPEVGLLLELAAHCG